RAEAGANQPVCANRRCGWECASAVTHGRRRRQSARSERMWAYLQSLLDSSTLSPHGICLLWRPELIWLHVVSDAIIALSYFSIPIALSIFVSKRPDVEFGWVFWAFAIFIMACGMTHVFSIWTLWFPDYAIE